MRVFLKYWFLIMMVGIGVGGGIALIIHDLQVILK